jgi:hypothetical protein
MMPTGPVTPEAYLRDRVRDQIQWYQSKAKSHEQTRVIAAILVFSANIVAAILALIALFTDALPEAWVGVVTTLVGVLATYMALTAADYLAHSYAATARQLTDLEQAWLAGEFANEPEGFRKFVRRVEQVISREHGGWNAVVRHASERD